jgi:hypothetical protein
VLAAAVWPEAASSRSSCRRNFLIGVILLDARKPRRYLKTFHLRRFWRIVLIYAVI